MASAWPGEETFSCSVCLETLKDPTTLPCGHTYCLICIQNHWDKEDGRCEYSCPQCRQVFNPRPSLAKSTLLVEAMEKLRTNSLKLSSFGTTSTPSQPIYLDVLQDVGQRKGSMYPQLPTVESRLCPQHNQPLDLFCQEDGECVCVVCCQHGHKGHHVLQPQEERKRRQRELVQMQAEVQRRVQESETMLRELPPAARQHSALLQALIKESSEVFPELVQSLNQTGIEVSKNLISHELTFHSNVEAQVQHLKQEVAQLHGKSEELSRLADTQDHVCFLKNFLLMEPLGQTGITGGSVLSPHEEQVIVSVRSVMKNLHESLQDLCRATVAKIVGIVNHDPEALTPNDLAEAGTPLTGYSSQATEQESVYEEIPDPLPLPPPQPQAGEPSRLSGPLSRHASAPPLRFSPPQCQASGTTTTLGSVNLEPKTREDMFKFRFEPTFDPNTVYRHMKLSDDNHKVTMRSENLNPPDHPERFVFWRQVLCKEPLAGSPYYWEVEWTGQKITIGVAYKSMDRKTSDNRSRLGHNASSWSLYWSGTGFSFWHDDKEKLLGSPKAKRIGVYLDQHAGILNFYSIVNNQSTLIHHHKTQFNKPLYPGFRLWAGIGDMLTICQLD